MKESLTDPKRSGQKKSSNSGYLSSYTEKYKLKNTKPVFNLEKSFQESQKKINQRSITLKTTNDPILISTQHKFKENKLGSVTKLSRSIHESQWIGQNNLNAQQNKFPFQNEGQNEKEQSLSSIEPTSPHQLIVKRQSNILIEEELQEDLDIYQHFRLVEKDYLQEMERLKQERQKIERECVFERKRIAESEEALLLRKKKLSQLQSKHSLIVTRNQTEKKEQNQLIQMYEQKLRRLKEQYENLKASRVTEIEQLESELNSSRKQNTRLLNQLQQLQKQLQSYNDQQNQDFKSLSQLDSQQQALLQEITSLQNQSTLIQKELQSLEINPISQAHLKQLHTQYLTIYQKSFILAQLKRAQQILHLKDQQKHQFQQIEKRKNMIKDKKITITLKQKKIHQKNKLIDKLTNQIRQKSTILLNLYQQFS